MQKLGATFAAIAGAICISNALYTLEFHGSTGSLEYGFAGLVLLATATAVFRQAREIYLIAASGFLLGHLVAPISVILILHAISIVLVLFNILPGVLVIAGLAFVAPSSFARARRPLAPESILALGSLWKWGAFIAITLSIPYLAGGILLNPSYFSVAVGAWLLISAIAALRGVPIMFLTIIWSFLFGQEAAHFHSMVSSLPSDPAGVLLPIFLGALGTILSISPQRRGEETT